MKHVDEDYESISLQNKNEQLQAEITLLRHEIEQLKLENSKLLNAGKRQLISAKPGSSIRSATKKDTLRRTPSFTGSPKDVSIKPTFSFELNSLLKGAPVRNIISNQASYASLIKESSPRRTSNLPDLSENKPMQEAAIKRTAHGLMPENPQDKKSLIKILTHRDEKSLSPRKEMLETLVNSVLKELGIDVRDTDCIYAMLKGIVMVVPDIMTKHITLKPMTCTVESHIEDFWTFTEQEITQLLDAVQSALIKQLQSKKLRDETYRLFKDEKWILLERNLHRLFADNLSKSFNGYIDNYNKDVDRHKYQHKHDFVDNYIYNFIEFKGNLKSLCCVILAPHSKLLNLSTILHTKSLGSVFKSNNFFNDAVILMWNEIQKAIFIPQQHKMLLATILFEKHKYIFCYAELERGAFLHILESLSWVFLYARVSEPSIKKVIKTFDEKFLNLEIFTLEKHLDRLKQGLIKLNSDTYSLSQFISHLQTELEYKESRLRFLKNGTNASSHDQGRMLQSIQPKIKAPKDSTIIIEPATVLPKIVITPDITDITTTHANAIFHESLEKK